MFLRVVIYLMGFGVLALCAALLGEGFPNDGKGFAWFFVIPYLTVAPFLIVLWQTLKLLSYIDRGTAFSERSVKALKLIKYAAVTIGALYALILPTMYQAAQTEDAPGVMLIGLVLTCAPLAIGVFAAVLQKVLRSAIDIKSENDLTV
ncbi:MAG TPA: DUF2975 domain-containing protein [Candidatus Saccharimonadales bacterium]|nr:DUF2975 domain-containing protein [Candidatus Saccharimonadales bacterium]